MKVDLNRNFKSWDGKELGGQSVAMAVAEALFNYGRNTAVDPDDKFRAYVLCQRIVQCGGSVEMTTEEASLVKTVCGECLTAGGYGQVYELIEGGK